MNKKALSLAITLAMALPTASHALGLGDIQSSSHLNEPFKGKIQVLSASPSDMKNLRVKIASPEVFNRVGIDRPAFLNSIRFTPRIENGKPVILVNSTQAIREPFVNFLLEVNWPKGQLLKEYTALLDPPVLMQPGTALASNTVGVRPEPGAQGRINRPAAQPARRAPVQRQVVRAPAPAPEVNSDAALRALLNSTPNQRIEARPTGNTYLVKRGDNLYKVAKKLGHRGVRTEQMMMALFEANPNAFDKANVNNLKAGVRMSRPSLQQAQGISYRSAKSQLISQTASWRKDRQQIAKNTGSPKSADSNASSSVAPAENKQARLEVMGSKGGQVSSITVAGDATVDELKKQLQLASESLTARSNENSELKSRVSELESLLRKKNRLITLKSEQLAELQARMGEKPVTVGESPENATTIVESDIDTANPLNTEVKGEGIDLQQEVANQISNDNGEIMRAEDTLPEEGVTVAETPDIIEEPEVAAPPVAVKPVEEDGGILGLLGNPMVTAIGGGSLLALLGGLFFMRRRKGAKGDDGDYVDFDLDQELANQADDNDEFKSNEFEAVDNVGMFTDRTVQGTDTDINEEGESKEENILQEADVYLVYGLHDQAEAELRKAIEEEPDNLAYRAKLIENFKASGNKEAFEKEAKIFDGLSGQNKEKFWEEIKAWGKEIIPESNIFSGASAAAGAAAVAGVAVTAGKATPDHSTADLDVKANEATLEQVLDDDELDELDIDAMLDEEFDFGEDSLDTVSADKSDTLQDTLDTDHDILDDTVAEIETATDNELDGFNFDDFTVDSEVADAKMAGTKGLESSIENIKSVEVDTSNSLDFDLDDSLEVFDTKLDAKKSSGIENTKLNLDIDSDGFNKIMPEKNAYKVDKASADASEIKDTLDINDELDDILDFDAIASLNNESDLDEADDDKEVNLLADFDDNLSFLDLDDSGEGIEDTQISTKLDLARAYMDMGDIEGARSTLEEVMLEGNDEQKKEAEELLHQTG